MHNANDNNVFRSVYKAYLSTFPSKTCIQLYY